MLYYDEIGSRQKMGKLCDKCQQFHSKKKNSKKVSEFSFEARIIYL